MGRFDQYWKIGQIEILLTMKVLLKIKIEANKILGKPNSGK
jgi:hypothetical protein